MQMEPQVSLGCEPCLHLEKILIKDGDCGVTVSFQNNDVQQPVTSAAKKQTLQWAAWTRQEEESFFTALQQVGKNFDFVLMTKNSNDTNATMLQCQLHGNKCCCCRECSTTHPIEIL